MENMDKEVMGRGSTIPAGFARVACKIPMILSWKSEQVESCRVLEFLKPLTGSRNCQKSLPSFMAPNVGP